MHVAIAATPERMDAITAPPPGSNGLIELPSSPAKGLVLLVTGSDGNRYDPCDAYVAAVLRAAGFATLVLDLSGDPPTCDRPAPCDIQQMADRLVAAVEASRQLDAFRSLPLGFFGAGTGTAVALVAAERLGRQVGAVVSRGGQLDLAGLGLTGSVPPTLLIAGRTDPDGLSRNRGALRQLGGRSRVEIAPDRFDEPDTLDVVVELALRWFRIHLRHKARGDAGCRSTSSPVLLPHRGSGAAAMPRP